MLTYLGKRLLAMVPTLFGITFVTFLIVNFAPGDPVAISFGAGADERANESGEARERQVDTIKAKKKLLGMLSEERAVLAWQARSEELPPPEPAGDTERVEAPRFQLHRAARLPELPGWPHALVLSSDGTILYATGDDPGIAVIDVASRSLSSKLPAQGGANRALAASSDSRWLASGGTDGTVVVRELVGGASQATTIKASDKTVRRLSFLPDGRLLAVSDDGRIQMLSLLEGKVTATFQDHIGGVYALAVSPDGSRFFTAGYDRKVREWDPASPDRPRRVLAELGQAVNDIALSPDGALLAAASDDRSVRLLSTSEDADPAKALSLRGHFKAVTAVAFSPDGRTLYTGSRDETVRRWDVASGRPIAMNAATTGPVHALLVSRDGGTLYSASDSWAPVPVWKRYLRWLERILTLDFDRSFTDDKKVIEKIGKSLPVTLGLNVTALAIIYLVSIPLGVRAAVHRGSTYDHVSSVVLFVLYSVPSFWAGTLLIMMFSSKQHWDILPSVGLASPGSRDLSYLSWLGDRLAHLVLPITVLVYGGFASLSRYARTSMLESISQDYVRTARAKGLSEAAVIYKHALRNSLITIVTLVANLLPAMVGGSVIVEFIFSIQGMGKLGFDAILSRDYPVIMAITTMSALLTLIGILVSDLLYGVVDPRIAHA